MNRTPTVLAIALAGAAPWGCPASILPLYEEARDEALADPGRLAADWAPDAVLNLSADLIDDLIEVVLEEHGTLDAKGIELLGARVSPDLEVNGVTLAASDACEGCLTARTRLGGKVRWSLAGRKGSVDVSGTARFDAAFGAVEDHGTWTVSLTPRQVRSLDLTVGRTTLGGALEGALEQWLEDQMLSRVPVYEVGEFGGEDLPLRALRVVPSISGLSVAMLTRAPSPGTLGGGLVKVREGWRLDIAQDSLLALARAASFEAGPVSYEVVVDPRSLSIGREDFEMGLRLWRPKGRGWWRDYTIRGTLEVAKRGLKLDATEVVEGDKSEGAALVDPLAALGEGFILSTIEDSVATTLPMRKQSSVGDLPLSVAVRSVHGRGDVLTVVGDLVIGESSSREGGSSRRGSESRDSRSERDSESRDSRSDRESESEGSMRRGR